MLSKQTNNNYLLVSLIAMGLWSSINYKLMIVPVWDEIPLYFRVNQFSSFQQYLHYIWFELRPYRPIAGTLLAAEQWLFPSYPAWPLLRAFNAAMIIASFWLMAKAAKQVLHTQFTHGLQLNGHADSFKYIPQKTLLCYWLACFLSPAALIVASWFANIFDASCLLLIAIGIFGWANDRWRLAGCMLGLAWFCKEAAIFVLPLLLYLYFSMPLSRKATVKSGLIYIIFGAAYWLLRAQIIEFGSASDVHPMVFSNILPTIKGVALHLFSPGASIMPGLMGLIITLAVALSARSILFFGFVFALITCAALAYLGNISFAMTAIDSPLISPAIFDARFFHIPLGLLMFGLLLQGRTWPFMLIMLSFTASIPFEFQRYRQFQLTYQSYYQLAEKKHRDIVIFAKPSDGVQALAGAFGVKIGEYTPADYVLNPKDGSLTPTQ